jgi:hypothetical protein
MKPQEHEDFLGELIRQARAQKRRHRLAQVLLLSVWGLFVYFVCFGHLRELTLPLIGCFLLAGKYKLTLERRWVAAMERMACFDDIRATGSLLEALDVPDSAVERAAQQALVRLLPRLQASDADAITEAQRKCLYRQLLNLTFAEGGEFHIDQNDEEFLLAALRALEQIGDAKAIPSVQDLADRSGSTPNAVRVSEAAQQCLVFLQQRVERQGQSASLLRASCGQDVSSHSLLRASVGVPSTDPQQLLRAAEAETSRG